MSLEDMNVFLATQIIILQRQSIIRIKSLIKERMDITIIVMRGPQETTGLVRGAPSYAYSLI